MDSKGEKMKKFITLILCGIMLFTLASCGKNTEAEISSETLTEKSEELSTDNSKLYAYMTDGDSGLTYYLVDFENKCIFMFYADEDNDTCFALPIEEGNLKTGINGSVSDGYSAIPFTMHCKDENQTDRVILTMEDAYDIELVETDIEEALKIKESKTIISLDTPEESGEMVVGDIYTADGQIAHRDRIVGKEDRIIAVIEDIEIGSGETISYEKAALMEASLDVYSDSSRDIKAAYTDSSSPYRELMEALDEYLHKSVKWHGTVMRGVVAYKEEAEKILSGEEAIDMLGPSSWTSDEVIAQNYARDKAVGDDSIVPIVYVLKDNKSGASITHLSRYGTSEREVLAPSGILYLVDSYETITVDSVDLLYVYLHEAE